MQFGLSLIQLELDSGVQSLRILEGIFESFLLIICTRRIVTRIVSYSCSAGFSDLPAYGRILLRLAIPNLRTVIVTAAVYWGFPSKLCLAANSSG
jgi:hypothetical protein